MTLNLERRDCMIPPLGKQKLLFAAALLICEIHALFAQTDFTPGARHESVVPNLRRFELGAEAINLRISNCLEISRNCPSSPWGTGVGITINLTPSLAIDTTLEELPAYDRLHSGGLFRPAEGGHASLLLAGLRGEVRTRRYGLFFTARPGVQQWSSVLSGFTYIPTGTGPNNYYAYQDNERLNSFALQLGGGLDYSAGSRVRLRVGLSDVLVHYRQDYASYYPNTTSKCGASCNLWTDNLETTAGVYYGFGQPLASKTRQLPNESPHAFFDKKNTALIFVSLLGQTSDAITTQRFLRHGIREADPLARPLVKYGWSGQIALATLVNGGEIGGMYWLHKLHHHRIERMIPVPLAAAGGMMGYRNDQGKSW